MLTIRPNSRATRRVSQTTTVVTRRRQPTGRQARRRRAGRRSRPRANPTTSPALIHDYCRSLLEPWCCAPTYSPVPTVVQSFPARAVLRQSYFTNADGTFAAVLFPTVNANGGGSAGLYINNSGAAGTTWAPRAFANATLITNAASEARVISYGMRIQTQVPSTAAPGFSYAGTLPGLNLSTVSGLTTNDPISWPTMRSGTGRHGAFAVGRPIDVDSYNFDTEHLTSASANTFDWTVPIIVFTGLPATSVVLVEVVINMECTPNSVAANTVDAAPDSIMSQRPSIPPNAALSLARQTLQVASGALDSATSSIATLASGAVGAANSVIHSAMSPLMSSYNQQQQMRSASSQLIPLLH
jgi:hypothetical protein